MQNTVVFQIDTTAYLNRAIWWRQTRVKEFCTDSLGAHINLHLKHIEEELMDTYPQIELQFKHELKRL